MAQYTIDFSGDTPGSPPTGWTQKLNSGNGTPDWDVAADAAAAGGNLLNFTSAGDFQRPYSYDASADGNTGVMDMLVRFKTPSSASAANNIGLCGFWTEDTGGGSEIMVMLYLRHDNKIRLNLYGVTPPSSIQFEELDEWEWSGNEWIYARCQIDNSGCRAKVWKEGFDEPTYWMLDFNDVTMNASREWSGMLFTQNVGATTHTWDWAVITTNGETPTTTNITPADDLNVSQASVEVVYNFRSEALNVSQASVEVVVIGGGEGGDDSEDGSAGYLDGQSQPYIRAWGFTLDGHDYYVLNLPTETLVYDFHSEQWYNWGSESFKVWAALEGINWYGNIGRLLTLYGNVGVTESLSSVLVGDNSNGSLYFLDPTLPHDSDRTGEDTYNPFQRIVYGQIEHRGRDYLPVDAIHVTGSVGENNETSSTTVTLSYSDNYGHTFNNAGAITTTEGNYDQRLEWRSLGSLKAPGRLFKIEDYGALQRIDGIEIHDNGS